MFFGVEGVIIWSLIRYRARRGRVAAQIHGNTRLEIGWTVGAALILVLITAVTFVKLSSIVDPPASSNDVQGDPVSSNALYAATNQPAPPKGSPSLKITVDGQQYVWRYQYPGKENVFAYTDMYVPTGVTVILSIKSDDVVHSWWIPKLGGKMDAVPGYTNHTWFKISKPGHYKGQCAELCGRNHANMFATRARGAAAPQYQAWYRRQAAAITAAKKAQRQGAQADPAAAAGRHSLVATSRNSACAPVRGRRSRLARSPTSRAAGRRGSRRPTTSGSGSSTSGPARSSSSWAASRRC